MFYLLLLQTRFLKNWITFCVAFEPTFGPITSQSALDLDAHVKVSNYLLQLLFFYYTPPCVKDSSAQIYFLIIGIAICVSQAEQYL